MNKLFVIVLIFSILIRITVSILNFYYIKDFLPHSGADSVSFERVGYYLLIGLFDITSYSWDKYPIFIYLIYSVVGREPFIIIGINGVLAILSSFFLYKIILMVTGDNKKALLGMGIFLFFPHNIIFSSVILRESLIVFFVSFSLYLFIMYTQQKKSKLSFLRFPFTKHCINFACWGNFYSDWLFLLSFKGKKFFKNSIYKKTHYLHTYNSASFFYVFF